MNVYYYIYYLIYRFAESRSFKWWSEVKAGLLMVLIESLILTLINMKEQKLFGIDRSFADYGKTSFILITTVIPAILNYLLFLYKDRWKKIVEQFNHADKKLKRKMNIYSIIVFLILIGVVVFLIQI